jgi:hypothetical protein
MDRDARGEESRRLYKDSQALRRDSQALCGYVQSLLAESTQLRLSAATLKRQIQHTLKTLRREIPSPIALIKLLMPPSEDQRGHLNRNLRF